MMERGARKKDEDRGKRWKLGAGKGSKGWGGNR